MYSNKPRPTDVWYKLCTYFAHSHILTFYTQLQMNTLTYTTELYSESYDPVALISGCFTHLST